MSSAKPVPDAVLDIWQFCSPANTRTWVYPDGCCDLIWHALPGGRPAWMVTALADDTYTVDCAAQQAILGIRLRPGTQIDERDLLRAVAPMEEPNESRLLGLIGELARVDWRIDEALASIAHTSTLGDAQRQLGVSERCLERLVRAGTGRSPNYWRQLARARRAVRCVLGDSPLAEVAFANGYTDQAHMGRDFQRWFAASPGASGATQTRFQRSPRRGMAVLVKDRCDQWAQASKAARR